MILGWCASIFFEKGTSIFAKFSMNSK
uniref:Uncharacterized protein n=1 Tax=Arundo donax TaxID=35708 RepID=A0A0A8ZUZ4_ARUDO